MKIERLTSAALLRERDAFVHLLLDVVRDGAGVGFIRAVERATIEAYWAEIAAELDHGHRILLAARVEGALMGAVQLDLAKRATGLHRAEIQKLIVDTRFRGRGVSKALMDHAEGVAREHGRSLLVLDTFEGTLAEGMYRRWGWQEAGRIPRWALDPEGTLRATVLFYKDL